MATEKELNVILQELVRRANDTIKRIRVLEERQKGIESRMNNLEGTRLEEKRDVGKELDDLEREVKLFNERLLQSEAIIDRFGRRFERFSTKSEIKELEAAMDLMSPLKGQFITKKEFETFKRRRA